MFEMCTFANVKFKCFDVMDKIIKEVKANQKTNC